VPPEIPDAYADLVSESVIATIGTINKSGTVHLTGVSTERDGTDFWVETAAGSVRHTNMRARSEVTLIWYDPQNPFRYVSLRGRAVEFLEQTDGARVGIRITPDHVIADG